MPKIPPKGRPIVKGERRNPNGSSAKARARAAAKKLGKAMTAEDLALLTSELFTGTLAEMQEMGKDEAQSFVVRMTAKLMAHAWNKGDGHLYRLLTEQVVGKPRERKTHEHSGPDGGPISTVAATEEEMLAELKRLQAARESLAKVK